MKTSRERDPGLTANRALWDVEGNWGKKERTKRCDCVYNPN